MKKPRYHINDLVTINNEFFIKDEACEGCNYLGNKHGIMLVLTLYSPEVLKQNHYEYLVTNASHFLKLKEQLKIDKGDILNNLYNYSSGYLYLVPEKFLNPV